jgi:hypothetical protein
MEFRLLWSIVMRQELQLILRRYLEGDTDLSEIEEVTMSFDWNDGSPESRGLQSVIGHLILLAEEVSEAFRDEDELRSYVAEVLMDLDLPPNMDWEKLPDLSVRTWSNARMLFPVAGQRVPIG